MTWGYEALPLPKTARILLYGPPGGGKSTAAAVIALSLASQGLPILILAVEEGLGESLVERFARCAGLLQLVEIPVNVTITDVETLAEAQEDLESWRARTGGGVVVIDSATELRASADWLRQVLCDDRLGTVIIAHQTTQGAPRGGWTCAYQVEVVVHVEALRARSTKSRWCPLGEWSVLSPAPITHAHPAERGAVIPFTREVRDGRSI